MLTLTSVATSAGVPVRSEPPLPTYGPSVPSRTTTKSTVLPAVTQSASGVGTPGYILLGRRLTSWSKAKRSFNNSPRSSRPLGICLLPGAAPTAPSTMASLPASSASVSSGSTSPVASQCSAPSV